MSRPRAGRAYTREQVRATGQTGYCHSRGYAARASTARYLGWAWIGRGIRRESEGVALLCVSIKT